MREGEKTARWSSKSWVSKANSTTRALLCRSSQRLLELWGNETFLSVLFRTTFFGERNRQVGFLNVVQTAKLLRIFWCAVHVRSAQPCFELLKVTYIRWNLVNPVAHAVMLFQKFYLTFSDPPFLLRQLLTSSLVELNHLRKYIRHCNSALAMASVRADFVARGPGTSNYTLTVTVHVRMYHEIGALIPPTGKKPRFPAFCSYETEQAAMHRKHFYGLLREELLAGLANTLNETNNLVRTFVTL